MRKNQIDVHMGSAVFVDAKTITVTSDDGSTNDLTAKDIVIATGASPFKIPGVEIDGERVVTYEEAILQEQLPKSVVIIGAGPIGLEFATLWNRYGADVTLVEMLARIAPLEDEEVSEELTKAFGKQGIRIMTGTKVVGTEALKTKVKVNVSGPDGDQRLEAEQALVAVGFKANTEGLGLDGVGVQLGENGSIGIDDHMATNIPGVWAIGDVTGKMMLAHVAMAMGIVCAENIAGVETTELNYEMLPRGIFCHPQVASFGLTEAQAKERGHEVTLGRFPFRASGKALGMGDYEGWAKLVVDAKYGEILGAHLIGPEVTELLSEISLAQLMELTPAEIARNVHIHPTLSEVIMEAAHDAEGHAIHI
jgi:dihydrolipoamide dehydrogenase